MRFKKGAHLDGADEEFMAALHEVDRFWKQVAGVQVTVTSGSEGQDGDGVHRPGSLHYRGRAADLRIWELLEKRQRPGLRRSMPDQLRQLLGPKFDVIDEGNHIHVEFDPKGAS